jgi:tRNA nucleotidyltransferase (CCA-adding enzyme)
LSTNKIPKNVKTFMKRLEDQGHKAYIVGGAVRDSFIGETPKDWDIFTDATGEEIQEIFPEGDVIGGEERQAKILTVVVDGIEISAFRKSGDRKEVGGTIDDHLATCDFTINAIAMDKDGNIYDPQKGREDLFGNGVINTTEDVFIRAVGDVKERFAEDKLRAFRAIRFQSKYDCKISSSILRAMMDIDISDLPPERIKDELMKIFRYEKGLELLDSSGLLEQIWPEFKPMHGMEGGEYHNEDVWTHTNEAYKHSCRLTDNVMHHIASALHDIGKPPCENIRNGKINFHGHNLKGAEVAKDMMERLKFSNQDIGYVTTLIKNHMFGISGEPRLEKGYRRLYEELERISEKENTPYPNMVKDLTLLFYCDYQGNLANPREKFADYLANDNHKGTKITQNYYRFRSEHKPFTISDLKVRGSDILNMGVPGGKRIGMLLQQVFNLTVEGILQNERHEQMFWLREQINLEKKIKDRRNENGY